MCCCPKRFCVVILGFFGFLFLFGFRTVFTLMMVYVIKENRNDQCTINGTHWDLQLDWSVATSQYFNTIYFIGYVLTQMPGGFLAVRFSPKRLFGGSVLSSSLSLLVMAFILRFSPYIVYTIRFIQGLAEGMSQSALNAVLIAWAPKSEKTRMVAFTYAGTYLSPSVASVVAGAATCYLSWHAGLLIYGCLGTLCSICWLCFVHDSPDIHPNLSDTEKEKFKLEGNKIQQASAEVASTIPWKDIFTSVPVSALFLVNFCRSWVFAMILTEIPQYFADSFELNVSSIGFLGFFPPIMMTTMVLSGGILVDKMIKSEKCTVTNARKLSIIVGYGSEAVAIIVLGFITNYYAAATVLCVGEAISGFASSGFKSNALDLAPQYVSVLTGITRMGTVGASVGTAIAGALRQKNRESWQRIFLITGSVHLIGVIYFAVFGSGTQQPWARSESIQAICFTDYDASYGSTCGNKTDNDSKEKHAIKTCEQ